MATSRFSQFIDKCDDDILFNSSSSIFIDDFELLKDNFGLLQKLVWSDTVSLFYSDSFECLQYIEENLKDYEGIELSLVDDFQNRDRSYMDLTQFEKMYFRIPFSYLLWNPKIQNEQRISLYCDARTLRPFSSNGYQMMSLDNLKRIRDIVFQMSEQYRSFTAEEKVLLVSNYLQNQVQYVGSDNLVFAGDGYYVTDSNGLEVTREVVGSPETVLFQNFGVCNAITNATTILLNNPYMDVNVRSVCGGTHAWNIFMGESNYFVDNTRSITRNKDRYPGSLKARSFSSDFLFFGTDTVNEIGDYYSRSICPTVGEDMARKDVEEIQKRLVKVASFSNYAKPVFDSKFENKSIVDYL